MVIGSRVLLAIGIASSLVAKLWAIRDGLQLCCTLALEAVEVESDALGSIPVIPSHLY